MKTRFTSTIIIIFVFTSLSTADELYSKNKKANQLYKNGEYQEALKMYDGLSIESPAEPKIKMNKGSALYQLKDLDKAEESYNAAAAVCKDKKTLADLYYNLGNIKYMQGEELSGQGKQEAMDKYKGALENYIKSLDIRPHDRDAKWNLQLASAKIKQMQQQNQQNKNDKNNKDQKQDQKQDQNKDQNQNKDQEKKDKQDDQQKKDEKKQDQKEQQNQQNENQKDQQKPEPTPAEKKEEMKKDEAKNLLELYSDDEHDLNKKPEKKGIAGQKRNEKDW